MRSGGGFFLISSPRHQRRRKAQKSVCVCVWKKGSGFIFVVLFLFFFTCAIRIIALPALCPVTPALGSPVGRCRTLPGPLLSAVGTGHGAIAPSAPLLPLPVHWGAHPEPGQGLVPDGGDGGGRRRGVRGRGGEKTTGRNIQNAALRMDALLASLETAGLLIIISFFYGYNTYNGCRCFGRFMSAFYWGKTS